MSHLEKRQTAMSQIERNTIAQARTNHSGKTIRLQPSVHPTPGGRGAPGLRTSAADGRWAEPTDRAVLGSRFIRGQAKEWSRCVET